MSPYFSTLLEVKLASWETVLPATPKILAEVETGAATNLATMLGSFAVWAVASVTVSGNFVTLSPLTISLNWTFI